MSELTPDSGLPQAVPPYVDGARRMTQAQFLQYTPQPFLLFPRSTLWDPLLLQVQASGAEGATKVVSYDVQTGGYSFICPIRKRKQNDDPRIYLGRVSKHNDMVIPVSSVSSRHACFLNPNVSMSGKWAIMDLSSSNGTWVNDEGITPNTEVPLESGVSLRLGGNLIAWFFDAPDFYQVLIDDQKLQYYVSY